MTGPGDAAPGKANYLIKGDNLPAMMALLDAGWRERVDLIYIDPPFWTGDTFTNGAGKLAYRDTWGRSIDSYLVMMRPRLEAMKDLLSTAGSIFIHVDWHAGHYIKILVDEIFGMKNLVNEIIWYYGGPSPVKTSFPRKHDTILYYAKSDQHVFHPQYEPLKPYLLKRARVNPDGRLWVDQNVGQVTPEKFKELRDNDKIFTTRSGGHRRKQYLDEMAGDMVDDVWTIPIINSQARERLDFPTQKPETLLERVISCAAPPGGVIADFFCGSGTTLAVAARTGHPWLGVDSSGVAIETTRRRLTSQGTSFVELVHDPGTTVS